MVVSIDRTWTRDVPAEWETALRELSPVARHMPWLALSWFPCYRKIDGYWTDCGRWLLSECVPEEIIPDHEDILIYLRGPRPSTLPRAARVAVTQFVNDYQWEMYRTHRVWARELWIIQGDQGGHATQYDQTEREIRRMKGLPEDPPAVGDLPYAPFDSRVTAQMLKRNRLLAFRMSLEALKRSGTPEEIQREWDEAMRAARQEYMTFITEQSYATADLVSWYSGKSDHRDELPAATPQEMAAAEIFADQYVQTGAIPTAA